MKRLLVALFMLCACAGWQGAAHSEIKKVTVPNVDMAPSLKSVMNQRSGILQQEPAPASAEPSSSIQTNGYALADGNIIVDSLTEPKCVFYGNYNEGSGDAFQFIDVDTIVFECQ